MSSQFSVPVVVDVVKKPKKKFKLPKVNKENYFLISAALLFSVYFVIILTSMFGLDHVVTSYPMLWLFGSVAIIIVINYLFAALNLLVGD